MERREQVNRYNDAYLANLVPGMRPKRNAHGRRYETPYLEVVLAMTGDADEVMGCVDASSTPPSTTCGCCCSATGRRCTRSGSTRSPTRCWRPGSCTAPTATTSASPSSPRCPTAGPAPACGSPSTPRRSPAPGALLALVEDLERTHDGALVIDGVGRLERVAAVSRATWLGLGASDEALDRVYGVRRLPAADAGFVPTAEREVPRYDGKLKKPVPSELGDPAPRRGVRCDTPSSPRKRGIWGRLR